MPLLSRDQYSGNRGLCINTLSEALREGYLVLLLGAGVSMPQGLPDWKTLLCRCASSRGINLVGEDIRGNKIALEIADTIRSECGTLDCYHECVTNALYGSFIRQNEPTALVHSILSLVSGSTRGKVSTIITLNFDDLLETYLLLNGYMPQVVSRYPEIIPARDVTIFHPHGFLPLPNGAGSKFFNASHDIVLGGNEFRRVLTKKSSPWWELFRSVFKQKLVLALGLGPGEPHLRKLFSSLQKEGITRPLCFWMVKGQPSTYQEQYFSKTNTVPIVFSDYDEYPEFLFSIARDGHNVC